MRAAAERQRRREGSQAALRYRERVAWISGFPTGRAGARAFVTVPERGPVATRALAPEDVGASLRAFRKIAHEGAAVLERAVPFPERIEPLLALLGEVARGERALAAPEELWKPRTRALFARTRAEAGADVADAVAWTFTADGLEQDALAWLASEAPRVSDLRASLGAMSGAPQPRDVVVRLARIATSGAERGASELLALLARPEHLHVGCATNPGKKTTAGAALLALIDDVLLLEVPARRRALTLASATYPLAWIEAWRRFHAEVAAATDRKAKEDLEWTYGRRAAAAPKRAPSAPPVFVAEAWRAVVTREAPHKDDGARALDRFTQAARAAVGDEATRLFVAFARTLREDPPKRFAELLDALARGLDAGLPPARLLAGWRSACAAAITPTQPRTWRESDVDDLPRALALGDFVRALGAMPSLEGEHVDRALDALVALAEHGVSLDRARRLAEAVPGVLARAGQSWADGALVALAEGLAEGDVARFEEMLTTLLRKSARRWYSATGLLEFARRMGVLEAIASEVALGRAERVARWSDVLSLLGDSAKDLGPPAPPSLSARELAWIAGMPAALEDALRELARVAPDAEARAARVLRREMKLPSDLDEEIAALRAKEATSSDARRARRLANLEARRAPGHALPAAVVRRAAKALAAEAQRARLEVVERALEASERAVVTTRLGPAARQLLDGGVLVPLSPVVQRELRPMLGALAELPSRERGLASALLARRVGAKPFDLRDAPANGAWIERMRARGVRLEAWFSDSPRVVSRGERQITLALEDDPLEVFLMGEHFETCLALQGGNFFSTVVNAADANKRVLFARENGAVVGRCLLAITEEATLLTFHPYAHDTKLALTEAFAEAARDLARRMGIPTAPRGRVLPIEASRWYDDGPRDLTGGEERLGPTTELVRELGAIAPEALVPRLEEAFAEGLDARVLSLVLGLEEIRRRPALVAALALRAFRTPFVAFETRLEVAQACHASGEGALAGELLRVPGFERWLLAPCPCGHCELRPNLARALDLVVDLDPFRAVHVLRASRPRRVRSYRMEDKARALAAARAYRAMGRPAQARRLLEQAFAGAKERGDDVVDLRKALDAIT